MANKRAAKKYILVSEKNRQRNVHYKSLVKTYLKQVFEIGTTEEERTTRLRLALKTIDKVTSKGIFKKNTGARKKSRLMARFQRALDEKYFDQETDSKSKKTKKSAPKKAAAKPTAKKAASKTTASKTESKPAKKSEDKAKSSEKVAAKKETTTKSEEKKDS